MRWDWHYTQLCGMLRFATEVSHGEGQWTPPHSDASVAYWLEIKHRPFSCSFSNVLTRCWEYWSSGNDLRHFWQTLPPVPSEGKKKKRNTVLTLVIWTGCSDPLMVNGSRETQNADSTGQEGIRAVTKFCFWHHSKTIHHPSSQTSGYLKFHSSPMFCSSRCFIPTLA